MRITTENEWLLKTTKTSNDELSLVQLNNGELNGRLGDAAEQRHFEQTEIGISKGKLKVLQAEKETAVENLKGLPMVNLLANFIRVIFKKNSIFFPVQTKQLQEIEMKLDQIIIRYEQLLNEKEQTDYELSTFKRINKDMNESLNQAIKECDIARVKVSGLSERIESLQIEKENIKDVLKSKLYFIPFQFTHVTI